MSRANEPAYPCSRSTQHVDGQIPRGLTIREHFAGLAMQGMLANPTFDNLEACVMDMRAVAWADALIAELEKPRG